MTDRGDEVALLETEPGTILCLLCDRRHTDLYRRWSKDNGRTWSKRESLRQMLDCVLQRPVLTRLDAKTLLLSGRDFKRRLVVAYLSRDNGQSFGERHVLDSFQRDGAYTTAVVTGKGRVLMAWYSDQGTVALKPDIKLATLSVPERPRWLWISLPASRCWDRTTNFCARVGECRS